jgi:thioredoxin-like negative regulator of GroEL
MTPAPPLVVTSSAMLRELVAECPAVLAYFSTADCAVCDVLKPRVFEMVASSFPHMTCCYVDSGEVPEAAAQFGIFTVPTVLAFFDGREALRRARHFGLRELVDGLGRPYRMLFPA